MAVMAIGVWFSYSCRHVEENVLLSKGEEEDLWLAMKRRSTLIRTRRLGTLLIYSPQLYQSHYGCYGFGRG